jgi:hypothetical protein
VLRKTSVLAITSSLLVAGATARADSGSLADPGGDFPDIVKVSFDNARTKVVMAMTYTGGRPQNESFYVRWGSAGRSYQVFLSPSAGLKELRYYSGSSAAQKKVACGGLVVRKPTSRSTAVTIPRSCLKKAPDALRFQGIATAGLSSSDQTKVSKLTARG